MTVTYGLYWGRMLNPAHSSNDPDTLEQLRNGWLKGGDWALYNACNELGLKPLLRLVYDGAVGAPIILDSMLDWEGRDMVPHDSAGDLLAEGGGMVIEGGFESNSDQIEDQLDEVRNFYGDYVATLVVHWVRNQATAQSRYVQSGAYLTYGNEASIHYLYAKCCLVVDIGPQGKRCEEEP